MPNSKIQSFDQQISNLTQLVEILKKASTRVPKLEILNALPIVQDFLKKSDPICTFLQEVDAESDYCIKSIIAIGQAPTVFNLKEAPQDTPEQLNQLLAHLKEIEIFYSYMGGIIGYHLTILKMISQHYAPPSFDNETTRYIHPEGIHLENDNQTVKLAVKQGLENLPYVAVIYPVGGAGDRLNLKDAKTGSPLPAALLDFTGRTLLEGLIRDLQAKEYLYFKMYGKQLFTPIVMMTSIEKDNHSHLLNICKQHGWFGRSKEQFYFFSQPLVPVVTAEGNWSLYAPLKLTLKPGGHGVIWKLAEEKGIFSKLLSKGYKKTLIRQINNPLAGTDHTLLALIGLGCQDNKAFGFISCERFLKTSEGTNVLIEKTVKDGFEYCLTNIEYTEFDQKGIGDVPTKPGSPYSTYPTNTNILFADIPSIRKVLPTCPIPGLMINMKTQVPYIDEEGHHLLAEGGRLECTMQNIADQFVDKFPQRLKKEEIPKTLRTFIAYNQRTKTISTTKLSYNPENSSTSTPEQAYYDILHNNSQLLKNQCQFQIPDLGSFEEYIKKGPGFNFHFHPALGPLYAIIAQKLRRGRFSKGSELQLEIAEVNILELTIEGSLLIESSSPLGQFDSKGILNYGNESRCHLHRVQIRNKGIDFSAKNCFWKNQVNRLESTKIILHEGSEFYAEDVLLEGNRIFEVPPHHRLTITQDKDKKIYQDLQPIHKPSWQWKYRFDAENNIKLEK